GLEHHEAKGIGAAWEHQDIGRGERPHQLLSLPQPGKDGIAKYGLQLLSLRALAHHHLGSRRLDLEKIPDAFFDRESSDIDEDRPGQVEVTVIARPE